MVKNVQLFIFLVFSFSNMGFSQVFFPEKGEVFGDDRVPRIDIFIPSDSLLMLMDKSNAQSDHHYKVTFIFNNGAVVDTLMDVGFRLRGNTSRNSAKKSFKISFNTYQPGRKYQGLEKLNLNGEHNDPSVIRSKVCWDLLKDFEIPAPRSNHVDLYVNGEYFGVYINVEHIDEEFVESRFGSQSGNLYKCLWPADLTYKGNDPNAYKYESGDRRAYDLVTNTEEDNYADLVEFIKILNTTSVADLPCELDKVLNVDNMIRAIAFDILSGNWDGPLYNKNNFYLYHNPYTGKFEYIPYDLDNTLGIDWFNRDWGTRNIYDWGNHGEPRPLYFTLLGPAEHRDRLSYYLDLFIEKYFNENNLFHYFDTVKSMISAGIMADPFRPLDYGFSFQEFLDSYHTDLDANHVTYGLKPFITARKNSALGQLELNNISPVIRNVFVQRNNYDLSVFSEVEDDASLFSVRCCYTQNGGTENCFDMQDNGTFPDEFAGDGRYSALLPFSSSPGNINYYVSAEDNTGMSSRYPVCKDLEFSFGDSDNLLVINEILTDNAGFNPDESGEYDDWIELYNSGSVDIFLGNKYLSDDRFDPGKWRCPDLSVKPGTFLLFWADNDEEQGDFHTSFKLSKEGEFVGLYEKQGDEFVLLHGYDFGPQEEDISFGSYPDGSGQLFALYPTPGSSNELLNTQNVYLKKFQVSPNPATGSCRLVFKDGVPEILHMDLFNQAGIPLPLSYVLEADTKTIFISSMDAGIYYIQIVTHSGVFVEKIIFL